MLKVLDYILTSCYGVYETADDIDWSSLPNQFVMKRTTGGGGLNVVIVKDKESQDIEKLKSIALRWTKPRTHFQSSGREWAYVGIEKNRVIFEELIEDESNEDRSIDDFKFLCFDGKFKYLWIDKNRYTHHTRGFWDEKLKFLNNVSSEYPPLDNPPELPSNINKMIEIAEKLSEDFPHARIDLYNVQGRIIFGEITFYFSSGYADFHPDSFDYELGRCFDVSSFLK